MYSPRLFASKSWRSPQYALGRALQDKPADLCFIPLLVVLSQASLGWLANSTRLVLMRDTHTQVCILSWNDDSAQSRSVKSHLSSEGQTRLAVPSNLPCKSVPSANLAPEQLGTSDLTAASQSECVSHIMHTVCMCIT